MPLPDIKHIVTLVKQLFPAEPASIEHVLEGVSTYVYRIVFQHDIFYLRILPEEGASFTPEVAVHTQLHHMQVKVPELIYYEHYNEMLQRSVMVTTEIKGIPVSKSHDLDKLTLQAILTEAGADLARLNKVAVDGFGWIARKQDDIASLRAEHPTYRAFALEYWDSDIAYLAKIVLHTEEIAALEHIRTQYDAWLEDKQGYLAHGDFDTSHIFQQNGHYSGIIDFGEIPWHQSLV